MNEQNQPHSEESEQGLLACCLIESSVYDDISGLVSTDDFYVIRNRIIFAAIGKLAFSGDDFSEIELLELLRNEGNEEQVGGIAALYQIMDAVETPSHARYFAEIVKEKSKLRQIQRLTRMATEDATNNKPSDTISAEIDAGLIDINRNAQEDSTIATATSELWEDIESMQRGEYEDGLRFGVPVWDEMLPWGMEKGSVTYLAAPTSCGKTQGALNVTLKQAITDGLPCGYFSYEMPAKQLARRMLQTVSAVNIGRVRDGIATPNEMKRVAVARDKLKASTILVDRRNREISGLASLARQWKRKHDIKFLVIDYLQQLHGAQANSELVASVAYNSPRIKELALDLNIPVIVLSQVNREAVKRLDACPDKGLLTHDLIGGSAIENDADNVLLWWPAKGDPDESREHDGTTPFMRMRGQFAKEREGSRGKRFDFQFIENLGRFK